MSVWREFQSHMLMDPATRAGGSVFNCFLLIVYLLVNDLRIKEGWARCICSSASFFMTFSYTCTK